MWQIKAAQAQCEQLQGKSGEGRCGEEGGHGTFLTRTVPTKAPFPPVSPPCAPAFLALLSRAVGMRLTVQPNIRHRPISTVPATRGSMHIANYMQKCGCGPPLPS